MRRIGPRLALLATCALPAPLRAQAAAAEPCPYTRCALRLEGQRLWRGAPPGAPAGRLGFWGAPPLVPLVAGSDSALAYAREFDRHYAAGVRLAGAAGVAAGLLLAVAYGQRDGRVTAGDWALVGGALGALAVGVHGQRRVDRARDALARALWWYNRGLPR
jgi:hypothetical protein